MVYCCDRRLQFIKHLFVTHSMEDNFCLVCGIKGCFHSFKFGSSFSSFKTHASRKHPNWQQFVNDTRELPLDVLPSQSPSEMTKASGPDNETPVQFVEQLADDVLNLPSTSEREQHTSGIISTCTCQSAQETAVLFLLRFKEQYKLPQTAINFAVGSINSIVEGVCDNVYESVQASLQI